MVAIFALVPIDAHYVSERVACFMTAEPRESAETVARGLRRLLNAPTWITDIDPDRRGHVTMRDRVLVEGRV